MNIDNFETPDDYIEEQMKDPEFVKEWEQTTIVFFEDNLNVGHPDYTCSKCGKIIEDERQKLILWTANGELEARFHYTCYFGLAD
jgi:hypothetical protein